MVDHLPMAEEEAPRRPCEEALLAVRSPKPRATRDVVERWLSHYLRVVAYAGTPVRPGMDATTQLHDEAFGEPGAYRKVHAGFGEGHPETGPVKAGDRAGCPLYA